MRQAGTILAAAGAVALAGIGVAAAETVLVFNGEGNRLNVYDVSNPNPDGSVPKRTLIESDGAAGDGRGEDMNAEICFFDLGGETHFIAGEDSNQNPDDPQGWGVFRLTGDSLASLDWKQVAKLVPTYQGSADNAENFGCGFLADGRLVLTDVGNQQPGGPGNGQLHVWFPGFEETDPVQTFVEDRGTGDPDFIGASSFDRYCKLDVTIPTSGGIFVDGEDRVYAASNRPQEVPDRSFLPDELAESPLPVPDVAGSPTRWLPGVYRYTNLPKTIADCEPTPSGEYHARLCEPCAGPTCPGDCVTKELVVAANAVTVTASDVAGSRHDTIYVSSVFNGTIAEYTLDGVFIQRILGPGGPTGPLEVADQNLQAPTPFGIAVGPDDTLYYADLGVVASIEDGIGGPGPDAGRFGRIPFLGGLVPLLPETLDTGLNFPDGVGVLVLP